MFRLLYQALLGILLIASAPFQLLARGRHYLPTLPGRLTLDLPSKKSQTKPPPEPLWIHAVSVGEVGVAATLVAALPEDRPLLITTVTPTGQKQALKFFAPRIAKGSAYVTYLPFDFAFLTKRFFDCFTPSLLLLVEGDYWPMVLREARRRDVPVAVINGRLSERSARRLQKLPHFLQRIYFDAVRAFGVQSDADRERLLSLGVPSERIVRTGNLKYETKEATPLPELEERLRLLAEGRPILIAGSTMSEEEEHVLDAFAEVGTEKAMLILVPRHPERWDGVAQLIEKRGFSLARRSHFGDLQSSESESPHLAESPRPDVVLLDSLGELASLYRIATSAMIGGTLVPTGGHNPLEAAHFGIPIVVGPSMHHFAEMAEHFNASDAWRQVGDAAELAATWKEWITDPGKAVETGRRGAEILQRNKGAVQATLEMLGPRVTGKPSASPASDR